MIQTREQFNLKITSWTYQLELENAQIIQDQNKLQLTHLMEKLEMGKQTTYMV